MKKEHKVVMLSTNEKAKLYLKNGLKIGSDCIHTTGQHLYILSDQEIKEGDWYFYGNRFDEKELNQFKNGIDSTAFLKEQKIKKIIATTNSELWKIKHDCTCGATTYEGCSECLELLIPKIPIDFVERYAKEYNKGKQITSVMLEYESMWKRDDGEISKISEFNDPNISGRFHIIPKIRSNNTVIISPVEERKYTREEVFEFGKLILNTFHSEGRTQNGKDRLPVVKFGEWFERSF